MRPRPSFRSRLLPTLLAAGLAAALAAPSAFGNSYTRGNWSCDDFQLAEKDYQKNPYGGYAVGYARYLLARGGGSAGSQYFECRDCQRSCLRRQR